MRIDKDEKIGDINALKLREVFKDISRKSSGEITEEVLGQVLELSDDRAHELMIELATLGYIEQKEEYGRRVWLLTVKGNGLASATIARPTKRKTAERILADFLKRVDKVRDDPQFLHKVSKAVLFGSMLSDKDRVNDIDIGVSYVVKSEYKDFEIYLEKSNERRDKVRKTGRRFKNITEESCWPIIEVQQYLKSRSKTLSLLDYDQNRKVIESGPHKTIYVDPF